MLDAYDVLRHPLPGAASCSDAELADYFRRERGQRFDPELVDCMLEILADLRQLEPPLLAAV